MMRGRMYIDGRDAFADYGVYVVDGGWDELVAMPPLKDVPFNDWPDEDGIEADLSEPRLNTREVSLKIATTSLYNGYVLLNDALSDGAYHDFDCRAIGRLYRLRLVSMPDLGHVGDLADVTIRLADDFPMLGYDEYVGPSSGMPADDSFSIDDRPVTDYGVMVLEGITAELMKAPAVKTNLLRSTSVMAGALYDPKTVVYRSKDIAVRMLMRADGLTALWRNYDALLYDLTRPGERTLDIMDMAESYPFYYRSCKVDAFLPEGRPWMEFTLTLTLTSGFRISDEPLLASEDSLWVVTEEDEAFVTLKPDGPSSKEERHT